MIEIKNLTRNYGAIQAVKDVSLTIKGGQIVGLLGHNGAGKTTMMKMMTGFVEPSSGSIKLDGVNVATHRVQVQKRIGYLPENAPLYPEMLVQDYLALMSELRGIEPGKIKKAVLDAAKATGITERLVQTIGTLSKGFRQRVGLAQAIIHNPDVLILDEPTNGLDPTQIRAIRELILELGKTTTILLSTHILQEIEAVCDRVLVLIDGQLAKDATLEELTGGQSILLSVQNDAKNVADTLKKLKNVLEISKIGSDPRMKGFTHWRLACADGELPVQEVIKTANSENWIIGGIAPDRKTLEDVFRDLEEEHVQISSKKDGSKKDESKKDESKKKTEVETKDGSKKDESKKDESKKKTEVETKDESKKETKDESKKDESKKVELNKPSDEENV